MIEQHLQEYRAQLEQHQRAIIALTGAIQALERLQKEEEESDGDEQDSDQD